MLEMPATRVANMQARRRRILDEAANLLAEGGYAALTLRSLADHAAVTVPTIYNLIGSKDAVVAALVGDALDRLDVELARLSPARGIGRAEAVITVSFALFAAQQHIYCSVFRSLDDVGINRQENVLGPLFRRAGAVHELAISEAVEAGFLRGRLQPLALAHNILHALMETFKLWALGALPVDVARARAFYALYVSLLADATKAGRAILLARIAPYEAVLNV